MKSSKLGLLQLDRKLERAVLARDKALRTFRLRCKHLSLAEEYGSPPRRICVTCGATERGWHCGYQVLVLQSERTSKVPPRAISHPNADRYKLEVFKNDWPVYFVGQSHENFPDSWDYKALTEIKFL